MPDVGDVCLQRGLACTACSPAAAARAVRSRVQAVIDELQRPQVFDANFGGDGPSVRLDFWDLVEYVVAPQD